MALWTVEDLARRRRQPASGAGGDGAKPWFAMRLLHARLRHEPVRSCTRTTWPAAAPSPASWRRKNSRATCAAAPATGPSSRPRSRWPAADRRVSTKPGWFSSCARSRRSEPVEADRQPWQAQPERSLSCRTTPQLLALRAANPKAQIVAGCTDVGLWVTKMHKQFERVLDVTRVEELQRVERYDTGTSRSARPSR